MDNVISNNVPGDIWPKRYQPKTIASTVRTKMEFGVLLGWYLFPPEQFIVAF